MRMEAVAAGQIDRRLKDPARLKEMTEDD